MANISGTFSDPRAGTLYASLSGTFVQGSGRDAGFPAGSSNVLLAGVVQGVAMPAIDRNAPVSVMTFEYPGGNVSWSVATTVIANVFGGGTASYGFKNLRLDLQLVAR